MRIALGVTHDALHFYMLILPKLILTPQCHVTDLRQSEIVSENVIVYRFIYLWYAVTPSPALRMVTLFV